MQKLKTKKKTKRFKGGGYVTSEEVSPGITILEMDGRGFIKQFVNKK